jgi:glyoxylase-like metal-dependent hydrolase (beta-lactamase superfamily II)
VSRSQSESESPPEAVAPKVPKQPKQEQERASSDVTEVAPGVLRCQLPIDMPGLGHVNCYVLEDERGVAVVDPGLPGRATLATLTARLASTGIPLRRVHTVIVTHSHPDHFGGAGWVRKETGADVVTHRLFHLMWDRNEPPDLDVEEAVELAGTPWGPPPWGGDTPKMPLKRRVWITGSRYFPRLARTPQPSVRLSDADTIRLAGREWVAVHTPGHTDDHLCLFDPTEGVMLSGDHVLPTITPHIGGFARNVDPLQRFFDSLGKVAALGPQVTTVLPAHGHPFSDLAGRANAIREHHLQRLDVVRTASQTVGRPMSVQETSTHLFSPRAQGSMADSETFAHLEHLRLSGEYRRHDTRAGYRYEPT